MNKINTLLCILWFVVIAVGAVLGEYVGPNCKYIVGFVFGCLSMSILVNLD